MDPSAYGQTPPPPPPPPAYSEPTPYGLPGQPPNPWTPAPVPPQRSFARMLATVGLIVVGVAVVGAIAISALGLVAGSNGGSGSVMFSKGAYQSGGSCRFDAPVTQITSSDSVYMIAAFKDKVRASDSIQLTITKDGAAFAQASETATAAFDCYVELNPLDPLGPGVYKMTFVRDGTVEAEGTLTVR